MSAPNVFCNAVIESAQIQFDRGSFLSCWVTLDYGGFCQGFGGYVLGGMPDAKAGKHGAQPNFAAEFIVGVMRAAEVERFGDLKGKTVRVEREERWNGDVIGIGHIVKDDRWFRPKARFAEMLDEYNKVQP